MVFTDGFLVAYIIIVTGIFGAVFGSFINCMAYRIVSGESISRGRSHCPKCNHTLGAKDLIPILSYALLKGKCRYCNEKISPRYVRVEIIMALVFIAIVLKYGVSFLALRYIVLSCFLMALSLVDLDIYEIPDRFIVCGILWYFITLPFMEGNILDNLKTGLLGGLSIGLGMLILSLCFDKITGKESLGGGDVKLFFMTGLYLGLGVGLYNLIISCIVGILFVIFMKEKRIPFGPAISISTIISILTGNAVVSWYLGLFL